jgi:hypothetical protein
VGLVYDEDVRGNTVVRVTEFGKALARWRPELTSGNVRIIAKHGSLGLSACQLRNPTRDGRSYGQDVEVFPFQFIWKAMLSLDGRITSDELNRAIFKTKNEADLSQAISAIRRARAANDLHIMGPEVSTGQGNNDRILIWAGWASFGWSLFSDKRHSPDGQSYTISSPWAWRTLQAAANIRHRHRDFASDRQYVEHISRAAGIPPDLR